MDEKSRRRRFRFGLRTLFAVVTIAALCLWAMRHFSSPSTTKVRVGMTLKQVRAFLGKPKRQSDGLREETGLNRQAAFCPLVRFGL